jgi:hypothetical protein
VEEDRMVHKGWKSWSESRRGFIEMESLVLLTQRALKEKLYLFSFTIPTQSGELALSDVYSVPFRPPSMRT